MASKLPVAVTQSNTSRLMSPQGTVLAQGTRISSVTTCQQQPVISATPARTISSTQPNVSLGRTSITVASQSQNNNANILPQTRIPALSLPLIAVNTSQARSLQTPGAKVITQSAQGELFEFVYFLHCY